MDSEALMLAWAAQDCVQQGQYAQANRLFAESLSQEPDLVEANIGLARLLCLRGNAAAALTRMRRLPDCVPTRAVLADLYFELGRYRSALQCYEQVLDVDPGQIDSRIGFARCLSLQPWLARDLRSRRHLMDSLESPNVDPALLAAAALTLLRDSESMLEDPLLLLVLREAIVTDLQVESDLVNVRRGICLTPGGGPTQLSQAIAAQGSLNEFVWPVSPEEQAALAAAPQWVRAMYEPVAQEPVASPAITPLRRVSDTGVQALYEQNPYPRWTRFSKGSQQPLDQYLRALTYGQWEPPEFLRNPRMLVAGCGTGREMLSAAYRWQPESVTGVDLSRTSLEYASAQAAELDIDVELLQADLLELGDWDREFDVVICAGVLHHLQDPLAGWRNLVRLLRPGGVMMIGLYSEVAREGISAAQGLVRGSSFEPTVEGIRAARQYLAGLPPGEDCAMLQDFYYTSGCRDMLFHVQETHFTIPDLAADLDELGLVFLDFDSPVRPLYRSLFGTSRALSHWQALETAYPAIFLGMYQLWCQRTVSK